MPTKCIPLEIYQKIYQYYFDNVLKELMSLKFVKLLNDFGKIKVISPVDFDETYTLVQYELNTTLAIIGIEDTYQGDGVYNFSFSWKNWSSDKNKIYAIHFNSETYEKLISNREICNNDGDMNLRLFESKFKNKFLKNYGIKIDYLYNTK